MATLHLVSHTHWDREWYQTFQQFRLRLVHLLDGLLALLQADQDYLHFTLDGQAIILEDYLEMRPERESQLRTHIQSGRLLAGPWYILPDEFLVSPEATIRNLLEGGRVMQRFGSSMPVGYIPDPFGHIGQMPQILKGFGIETACLWRGLDDQPCEFWWQAPDGSRVLLAFLRDGYGNAAALPAAEPEQFAHEVQRLKDVLQPHAQSSQLLLMHGTDHMEPSPETSAALKAANQMLGPDRIIHSTLPAYLTAMQAELSSRLNTLPVVQGELRASKRTHLLPNVLSTRMWIKQRNHVCQTLMEKWSEPFSTWANLVCCEPVAEAALNSLPADKLLSKPDQLLRQAWRLLLTCHPHDSICGCSIDQVHDEMKSRFDQVEQIGEEITRQSLVRLAEAADTRPPAGFAGKLNPFGAIPIFNSEAGPRNDSASVDVIIPAEYQEFDVLDENGQPVPFQANGLGSRELINFAMDRKAFQDALGMAPEGRVAGMAVQAISFIRKGNHLEINLVLSETGEPNAKVWQQATKELNAYLREPGLIRFVVHARSLPASQLHLLVKGIPGYGYRTYWLVPKPLQTHGEAIQVNRLTAALGSRLVKIPWAMRLIQKKRESSRPPYRIENEEFLVEADSGTGTLTIKDKRTNIWYKGLNRFENGGDCGDEYNYAPPAQDEVISKVKVRRVQVERDSVRQSITITMRQTIPLRLSTNRQQRCQETVHLNIVSRATLIPGTERVDIHTEVVNLAEDHRLRVLFPAPIRTSYADYDGHFEVVRRSLALPEYDTSWVELPRPEQHQRAFTDISNGKVGLMIANRGLPEIEVRQDPQGEAEIALTLLRCVGWLSRDDFSTRRGHAGPMLATPGAQMLGEHSFDYAILPHAGDWQSACQQAYDFNSPLRGTYTGVHVGKQPSSVCMLEVQSQNHSEANSAAFIVSAIKICENGNGWLVRGVNLLDKPAEVKLKPWRRFSQAWQANLAETRQNRLEVSEDGSIRLQVKGHSLVTVEFSEK